MNGFTCKRCKREVWDIYQLNGHEEWLCNKCIKVKKKELGIVDDPRLKCEVMNVGVTESGMTLKDKEGDFYHWLTKSHSHRLFFMKDWVWASMTLLLDETEKSGKNIVKNIRLVSK